METTPKIRPRERDAIIQSLKAGVTPRTGLQHIQVGRVREVESLLKDIDRIVDGGTAFRMIIGDFGSGKSFFLHLIRMIALEKGLVTLHADLTPERRLYGTGGLARNLYAELMRNCSTRTKADGGALTSIVERFISEARQDAEKNSREVSAVIESRLKSLTEYVGGYDFSKVVGAYWKAYESGDEDLKASAVQWLRGEFANKTEAKKALGVPTIVEDKNMYDTLKLLSLFVVQCGYKGLWVSLDEMVNLYKIANKVSRTSNYEQLLKILNDCLQGQSSHIGFLFCGTPDFLMDPRKGLYSYDALKSRLSENTFAEAAGVTDYSGTILHLPALTPEELLVLLKNIRRVFASGEDETGLLPDEALLAFLNHCANVLGEAYFRTPRNTIKAFVDMLSVLEQNPTLKWSDLVAKIEVPKETNSDMPQVEKGGGEDSALSTFEL
ncbi:MAG: ATP-binding protein [Deltaproteobacteria bacterium]|jgi:hypothetical protein|nr:ATP-binding protein [Deltaproteobacteria bacterium]